MKLHKLKGQYLICKGEKYVEKKFRTALSKLIVEKFGKGPFDETQIREILTLSIDYYIKEFNSICHSETSVRFYQDIFTFHEEITEFVYKYNNEKLSGEIDWAYIAGYRRILKFILEAGCDIKMLNGEIKNEVYIKRVTPKIDELLFLGEMILTCVSLYAEQSMIEDVAEVKFDENDEYTFSRRHHYEFIFDDITRELDGQFTKTVVDDNDLAGLTDLKKAIEECFSIKYDEVGGLIARIHEQLKPQGGQIVGVGWKTLPINLNHFCKVPIEIAEQFFRGLTLDRTNKMTLLDLACRPYNLNRYIYKPIIIWNINDEDYALFGKNAWAETFIQLSSNAIPWGKAPKEWLENKCFKKYVHRKEDAHDKWLDDEVEKRLKNNKLLYDRNVKKINYDETFFNIDVQGLGEIDFIIISPNTKTVFITDCKHLIGRYDTVNQKNDFNVFSKGSKNTKSYNETISRKVKWFDENKEKLNDHFNKKYPLSNTDIRDYKIEGIFIINTPTLYMYNSEYRIYTVSQIEDVLNGKFIDKTFTLLQDEGENQKLITIKYPYFKKPTYIMYDPFEEIE
ncbi:hypothetical protein [Flavobacterium aquatile]|uniref:NERD domain-containing protein n=1 Tax=Flavobacterium aquatile LMG 4008 = ATCC 11947 TaxID=1453498 RepID=A0A095SYQ1_9FLAO|nr:hypothetical protein [Flavobacterium aquatile]KGD69509.1 hypothetical protein LG45_01720 [Flavobacterium aquatile LMG 4008 = ATCC 11947]OXA66037.1 hypothetical protein B0A61_12215 [Flavobacterium aquatile LMG 4008 = ATCC 11947]GEC77512.1 hypothetical protein FAQ01_03820 [Flavobacterium aquatile]